MDTQHRKARRKAIFKLVAAVFVLGVCVGGLAVYLAMPGSTPVLEAEPCSPTPVAESSAPKQAKDFAFYDTLENAPMTGPKVEEAPPTVPPVASPPVAKTPPPASVIAPGTPPAPAASGPLYLQMGSFAQAEEAERLREKIAGTGLSASVQAIEIANLGVRHRVRVGPFAQRDETEAAKAQLQAAGINTGQAFLVR